MWLRPKAQVIEERAERLKTATVCGVWWRDEGAAVMASVGVREALGISPPSSLRLFRCALPPWLPEKRQRVRAPQHAHARSVTADPLPPPDAPLTQIPKPVRCHAVWRCVLQGMTQLAWGMVRLGAPPSPAFVQLLTGHAAERLGPGSGDGAQGGQEQEEGEEQQEEGRRGGRGRGRRGRALLRYRAMDVSTLMYVLGSWGLRPDERLTRRLVAAVQVGACVCACVCGLGGSGVKGASG